MGRNKLKGMDTLAADYGVVIDTLSNSGNDIAVVVTAASFIDSYLGAKLENHFRKGSTAKNLIEKGALSIEH